MPNAKFGFKIVSSVIALGRKMKPTQNVRNRVGKAFRIPVFLVLITAFSIARSETPKVFWHSQPVKPNETVMVQGHAISTTTLVDVQRLDDGARGIPFPRTDAVLNSPTRIAPLLFGESLLNFVIPSDWPQGVFAYRLANASAGPACWPTDGRRQSRARDGQPD